MSTDKKPEDQITEAGAVELDETQLDDAAGGIIAVAPAPISPEQKYNTGPHVLPTSEYKYR
jgi:hypothetical protein